MASPKTDSPGHRLSERGSLLLRRAVHRALSWWRRSLRARVVVSIVALCAVVLLVVLFLMVGQIRTGLVHSRVNASLSEARSATVAARQRLSSSGGSSLDPQTQLDQLVETLVTRGEVRGYDVLVVGPVGPHSPGGSPGVEATPGVAVSSVPHRLRETVERNGGLAWTYTGVRYDRATRRTPVAGVAIGSTVVLPSDGRTYAIYYVFPMNQEQRTLSLLRQALVTGSVLMLMLVAGVAWLVTRQVITPVRLARRVAERIASGRLEERMRVSGEDDIARLATSFNQMADALQKQIRQLVDLSRVQRRFVSDVSHELRTPLTTVRMAGDVLYDARRSFDPVTARSAELLQVELDRFESLLADLLEISRFDAGAAVPEMSEVDLVDLTRREVDAAAGLAAQREVRVEVEADEPVTAEVDGRRIARVVRNLITNAIDHAGAPGAVVQVRLACNEDTAAVTVRDHGIGLEPDQLKLVFSRFWRADPARARTSGGTGLGLAIAMEDARLHGGLLEAWGRPGQGAQFRLLLPRHAGGEIVSSPLPLVPEDAELAR